MAKEKFKLSEEFIKEYENKKPPFGFNGLGELTYIRTYSRIKENGSNEDWKDIIERVTNGTFSIQKRWIKQNKLRWNEKKAKNSAQMMFDKIYNMKFMPPGRGLWSVGSPIIEERDLFAAANNCFAYETEIITIDGIKQIGDLAGTEQILLTKNGEWVSAPINNFGYQRLVKLTLSRMGVEKVIYVTANHRWFAKSQSEVSHNKGFNQYTTEELKEGYRLQYVFEQSIQNSRLSPFGIAQGIAFSDGTVGTGELFLCGDKDKELLKWFPNNHVTNDPYKNALRVADLPLYFKHLPPLKESKAFLYGWLAGYFAADGVCDENGNCRLESSKLENLEFVRDLCAKIGIGTYGIRKETRVSNLTSNPFTMYTILFMRDTLAEDFFIINRHKENFIKNPVTSKPSWSVVSIEDTDRVENVYCATVEGKECFALADNILTMNCGFYTTENIETDGSKPFRFLMDMSMLGVGIGFDVKGAEKITILGPTNCIKKVIIDDTREGWVDSTSDLLDAYFFGGESLDFDYSLIRSEGEPIKGFGGVSSGAQPLIDLHKSIVEILSKNIGKKITATIIVDIMNLIGKAVVAGNVRRTAEIVFGEPDSEEYLDLKNYNKNPHRAEYGWTSNNSVFAKIGMDYSDICDRIQINGEPGLAWLDNMRDYSRMIDQPDYKDDQVAGGNPCLEQSLESAELCTLVETFLNNHETLEEFLETLKFAYMYAKTITLGQTHWEETNEVMMRNRRIGCSLSGVAQFMAKHGIETLRQWLVAGYAELERLDKVYSDWLCVPLSIKKTSNKPSGTVSLVAGAWPGIHHLESRFHIRRMRLSKHSKLVKPLKKAGYNIEPAFGSEDSTVVVEIPVDAGAGIRSLKEVSMWEQLAIAAFMQRYWADNQVSVTITFDPESEGHQIKHALNYYQYQLKGVSFLPRLQYGAYPQMPYEEISELKFEEMSSKLKQLNFKDISGEEANVEKYCNNDSCTL